MPNEVYSDERERFRETGPREVLDKAACTLGWLRMPLKIAAPCSISVCTTFNCATDAVVVAV